MEGEERKGRGTGPACMTACTRYRRVLTGTVPAKLRTAQTAMERKVLNLKLQDKIPYSEIRKRTKTIDITEYTLKQKWRWAEHIARLKDNRWTKRWHRDRRDQEDDQAEDGKTTKQGRREPPGSGKQQTEDNGRH